MTHFSCCACSNCSPFRQGGVTVTSPQERCGTSPQSQSTRSGLGFANSPHHKHNTGKDLFVQFLVISGGNKTTPQVSFWDMPNRFLTGPLSIASLELPAQSLQSTLSKIRKELPPDLSGKATHFVATVPCTDGLLTCFQTAPTRCHHSPRAVTQSCKGAHLCEPHARCSVLPR